MDLYITGGDTPLRAALELRIGDRLLHRLVHSRKSADLFITFSPSSGSVPQGRPQILIRRYDSASERIERKGICEIRLRDLLAPASLESFGEPEIDSMLTSLASGKDTDPHLSSRHWVGTRDVIDAIETLIEHPEPWGCSIEVCGRRCWDAAEVFSELKMLWRRFEHGRDAMIDVADLEPKPPRFEQVSAQSREPELSSLHRLLKDVNNVGWMPLTPMRIALMELLSDWSDDR